METELVLLENLSVDDLEPVFVAWNFATLVPVLKEESVNGAMLSTIDCADDLEDFGVEKKFRRGLFLKIQQSKTAGGVPKSFFQVILILPPSIISMSSIAIIFVFFVIIFVVIIFVQILLIAVLSVLPLSLF